MNTACAIVMKMRTPAILNRISYNAGPTHQWIPGRMKRGIAVTGENLLETDIFPNTVLSLLRYSLEQEQFPSQVLHHIELVITEQP